MEQLNTLFLAQMILGVGANVVLAQCVVAQNDAFFGATDISQMNSPCYKSVDISNDGPPRKIYKKSKPDFIMLIN